MLKFKKLALLLSGALILGALSGCNNGSGENVTGTDNGNTDGDIVKVGVFLPLTGDSAGGGELEMEGIELAHELYPEVLGKKVELVKADNKSDKAESANVVAKLIERDKVSVIVGSYGSSFSMAAGSIVENGKVPAIGTSCTNPQVTLNNDYYFRVCFIDPYQGSVMANYAYHKLNAKNAVIIQEVSNDYSVGLAAYFKESFVGLTGDSASILSINNYQTGDKDFSALVTNIKEQNPDVIFAPGDFTASALLIKQARQQGITAPFIGGDTWETEEFLAVGGAEVEGAAFSTSFAKEKAVTDEAKKFLDAFYKKYPNREPSGLTVLGYDAYLLSINSIERAGDTDPVKIRDAIAATDGFEGASGIITLDENGDAQKDAVIKMVKSGRFEYHDAIGIESN